ncbi:hypothetical protein [Glaciihabitans sp. dw_435]|uniref:hypothetical protein n=1 Tax=Glaciihabitans sp. dw_435 TaxID=2720081 RepID=UPI001BD373C6|nr:hypothetical protein [Glaciihabitans sp. dw_435]
MMSENNVGVGAQVFVRDASATDPSLWPTEPSGFVVAQAGSGVQGVWGRANGGRVWSIEFDEPQINANGDGPFSSALVHERFLQLAPPVEFSDEDAPGQ